MGNKTGVRLNKEQSYLLVVLNQGHCIYSTGPYKNHWKGQAEDNLVTDFYWLYHMTYSEQSEHDYGQLDRISVESLIKRGLIEVGKEIKRTSSFGDNYKRFYRLTEKGQAKLNSPGTQQYQKDLLRWWTLFPMPGDE